MAYLGTEKLRALIKDKKVIVPDLNRVECGAYELSLGNEVFTTDSKDKKKEFLTQPKQQVTINPGQFALLLSHETVNIPPDKIAFISIKAKIKLKGLVNVSGFHVDPGFKGNLVFSVYNAGSSPISLLKEEPCFLIWFADLELTKDEQTSYDKGSHEHKNQNTIPTTYIDALLSGELASPNVLHEKIKANYSTLDSKINTTDEAQKSRISLIEKEQTAKDYLVKAAVGLFLVVVVKMVFDWLSYDNGFKKGIELKQKEATADSIINQRLIEKKTLLLEIDSLQKVKKEIVKTQPENKTQGNGKKE